MCVSGGRERRGVAGQLERSLVKKSIKEKQRRKGGEELFLLAAVSACKRRQAALAKECKDYL